MRCSQAHMSVMCFWMVSASLLAHRRNFLNNLPPNCWDFIAILQTAALPPTRPPPIVTADS